jgi:hypothetical protein
VDQRDVRRRGDIAEKDATFAVRFALAAVEGAEYAVLYATLARMDADSWPRNRADEAAQVRSGVDVRRP